MGKSKGSGADETWESLSTLIQYPDPTKRSPSKEPASNDSAEERANGSVVDSICGVGGPKTGPKDSLECSSPMTPAGTE